MTRTLCRRLAPLALLVAAVAALPAGAQQTGRQRPGYPPVVCPSGTLPCSGAFGQGCYAPAQGQQCARGLVCSAGTQACVGPYGRSCYAGSMGQSCMQGLVCGSGQQICAGGGYARCYSPSLGERCG